MTLYNCKQVAGTESYVITKFTDDLDVESSYVTSREACECPAGTRDTCRHRKMLPRFIARGGTAGEWFLDFEAGKFIRAEQVEDLESDIPANEADAPAPAEAEAYIDRNPSLAPPPGVTVMTLDDPAALHNAIADAVGEPRIESDIPTKVSNPEGTDSAESSGVATPTVGNEDEGSIPTVSPTVPSGLHNAIMTKPFTRRI